MRRMATMALLACGLPAAAQQPVDPGRLLLDEVQRRQLEREETRKPGAIEIKPEAAPKPAPDEGVCFDIDRIELEGASLLEAPVRDAILARYTGRCLARRDINALLSALTEAYVERGYITTRVYIPPQNLSTRVLRLLVIEGRVEGIRLNEDTPDDRRRAWAAFPTGPGEVLRLQDIEQGLDQLNRVPSSKASVQLEPGKEPGTSAVVVTDRPQDRFRGTLGYDNYGQTATGERRLTFGMEADNLLSLNDAWALYYAGTIDSNAIVGTVSFGLGNWTLGGAASYSESVQHLTADAELFSRYTTVGVFVERLLERSQSTKTNAVVQFNTTSTKREVNDFALTPLDLAVARVGARHQSRLEQGVLFVDGLVSFGTTAFGATKDPANPLPDEPLAQFVKVDAGATWLAPIGRATLRSMLRGQFSPDALYNPEQIVVGGSGTVRGYAEAAAFGDSGWFTRNELALPLPRGLLEFGGTDWTPHVQPFVFADGGQTFLKAGNRDRSLVSAGAGLRLVGTRLSFEIALAYPIVRNDLPVQELQARVAFQLW